MLKHTRIIVAFASILALAALVIACGSEPAPTVQPSESTTTNTSAATEPAAPVAPSSGAAGVSAPDAATTQPEVPSSGGSAAPAQPAAPTSQPMAVAPIPSAQPLPVSQPTVVAPTATPVSAPTAAAEPTVVPTETVDTAAGCLPPLPPAPSLYEHHETTAETDRAALIELFNAEPEGDINLWPGIRTNQDGRVTELALRGTPDSVQFEQLSEAIGDLSYLEVLDLSNVRLQGSIPPTLGNLPRLRVLKLDSVYSDWLAAPSDSEMSMGIPPELGSLANLEVLNLQSNKLSGEIPPQLCNLTNLKELDLSSNPLDGEIPAFLSNLNQLEKLVLNFNNLTGTLLPELGNLSNLRTLSLFGNRLEGEIPAELGNLSNLKFLDLGLNPLTGEIPEELGQLTNLTALSLGINRMSGDVPEELGNLESLVYLSLGHPVLDSDSPWEDGSALENGFTGCVPANLPPDAQSPTVATSGMEDMGSIVFLVLTSFAALPPYNAVPSCSMASGPISPGDAAKERQALIAIYGFIGGDRWDHDWWEGGHKWLDDVPVGEWRGVITDNQGYVIGVGLPVAGSTAELAPEVANLTYLRRLQIWKRGGSGISIPSASPLGSLTHLQSLVIEPGIYGDTSREGHGINSLLPQLGSMNRLLALDLSETDIIGEIPTELGNLPRLAHLDLSRTNVAGQIPPELGNLNRLAHLNLSETEVTGELPPEIGNLNRLGFLDLSSTELAGEIPPELGNLTQLRWLRLNSTGLTGCVPASLKAQGVDHYGKPFCAAAQAPGSEVVTLPTPAPTATPTPAPTAEPTPAPVGGSLEQDREALVAFYHAAGGPNWRNNDNWLTDAPLDQWRGVRMWDGRVVGLQFAYNNLTSIPPEVAGLSSLFLLVVQDENFESPIATELADIPNLRHLNLTRNGLSGEIPAWLGDMTQLRELYLRGNNFTGEIPPEFGNLSNLEALSLSGNFSGDLEVLGKLSSLVYLHLDSVYAGFLPPDAGGNEPTLCVPRVLKGQLGVNKQTGQETDLGELDFC